jgi:hypothetical protein
MPDSAAAVRRFLAGHRAAAARQRQLLAERGADSAQSVAECLDVLEMLEGAGAWPAPRDPVEEREIRRVRDLWARVKRGYRVEEKR